MALYQKPQSTFSCVANVINRSKLQKNVYNLDQTLRNYDDDHLNHILPYGSEKYNFDLNKEIISWPSVIWKILNLPIRVSFEMSALFCYYYYYLSYSIASPGWFLTYIYCNYSNDAFQSYYDPFQVNWLAQT